MALSPTVLCSAGQAANGTSYVFTMSRAIAANELCLVFIWTYHGASTNPGTPTLSGGGVTWVQVANYLSLSTGVNRERLTVFRALGSTPSGTDITADYAGATQNGYLADVVEITGADQGGTNGSSAIVQSQTGSVNASGTSETMTMSASLQRSTNMCIAAIEHDANEVCTPGSGATELSDHGTGGSRQTVVYEIGNHIVSSSWTTSAAKGSIAVEVRDRKELAGSITPTGTLARLTSRFRSFAGSITPTGALTTMAQRAVSLAGSITPTGTLTAAITYFISLAGAITPVGGLVARKVRKLLHDSITGAVSLATRAATALSLTRKSEASKTLTQMSEDTLTLTEKDETTDHPVLTELDEENA